MNPSGILLQSSYFAVFPMENVPGEQSLHSCDPMSKYFPGLHSKSTENKTQYKGLCIMNSTYLVQLAL